MRIARSRLCANSVCQRSGIQALKGSQKHIEKINQKLRKRRDFSYERLNEIKGISTAKPDGAFYIFPKIEAMEKGIWKDDKEFVLDVYMALDSARYMVKTTLELFFFLKLKH